MKIQNISLEAEAELRQAIKASEKFNSRGRSEIIEIIYLYKLTLIFVLLFIEFQSKITNQ